MRSERIRTRTGARSADMLLAAPWSGLERLLLAAIAIATLFCTLITPPFQAPDENQHYMKALLLSEGRVLTEQRGDLIGATLPRAAVDFHAVDFPTDVPPTLRRFDRATLERSDDADAQRPALPSPTFPMLRATRPLSTPPVQSACIWAKRSTCRGALPSMSVASSMQRPACCC